MSLKTWMKEFYPISAKAAARQGELAALEHSLTKYVGTRKANLKKHHIKLDLDKHMGLVDVKGETLFFNFDNCSLCEYDCLVGDGLCDSCPLLRHLSEPCDGYNNWCKEGDPEPMIKQIKQAMKVLLIEQLKPTKKTKKK